MPFKTITIKKDVYRDLVKAKESGESFSEFFGRILKEKRPDIRRFYGAWKLEKGEEKKIKEAMKKERFRLEESFRERTKRFSK